MPSRKKQEHPTKRPLEEARRRFSWTGDDVLHLQVDGAEVESTPAPTAKDEE